MKNLKPILITLICSACEVNLPEQNQTEPNVSRQAEPVDDNIPTTNPWEDFLNDPSSQIGLQATNGVSTNNLYKYHQGYNLIDLMFIDEFYTLQNNYEVGSWEFSTVWVEHNQTTLQFHRVRHNLDNGDMYLCANINTLSQCWAKIYETGRSNDGTAYMTYCEYNPQQPNQTDFNKCQTIGAQ